MANPHIHPDLWLDLGDVPSSLWCAKYLFRGQLSFVINMTKRIAPEIFNVGLQM